jgi:hypothetical protein
MHCAHSSACQPFLTSTQAPTLNTHPAQLPQYRSASLSANKPTYTLQSQQTRRASPLNMPQQVGACIHRYLHTLHTCPHTPPLSTEINPNLTLQACECKVPLCTHHHHLTNAKPSPLGLCKNLLYMQHHHLRDAKTQWHP